MFRLLGYDHVGIRVTDLSRALEFYALIGFRIEPGEVWEEHDAVGLINDAGLRINLIYNGLSREERRNVLMDEPEKWPGLTHFALVVDSLEAVVTEMAEKGIALTGGPLRVGSRRTICFVRDPDGNVIEFDELLSADDDSPVTSSGG